MSIKLEGITLPSDLMWKNEFDWLPVRQTTERSIAGSLIVQPSLKVSGRPITLFGGENACWVNRSVIEQLYQLASVPGKKLTLEYFGQTKTVIFDHENEPLSSQMVMRIANPSAETKYTLTIRLIEV